MNLIYSVRISREMIIWIYHNYICHKMINFLSLFFKFSYNIYPYVNWYRHICIDLWTFTNLFIYKVVYRIDQLKCVTLCSMRFVIEFVLLEALCQCVQLVICTCGPFYDLRNFKVYIWCSLHSVYIIIIETFLNILVCRQRA